MNAIFKALSDSTRREILNLLKVRDLSAGEISSHFNISKPGISHHLNILLQSELIKQERQGQHIKYSLNTTVFQDVISWILDLKRNNH